ncbi:hypothetical protein [Streptomyces sp900116325]|uniref:hypothetical protein n=1 Tax=Streptomyces sp. 900116325 TaxID=3154295 RepID=UPI0033B2238D
MPAQASDEAQPNRDHVGQGELDQGAEAIATMERALAQQRQIYDALGGGTLAAAMLYDPNRGERRAAGSSPGSGRRPDRRGRRVVAALIQLR